MIVPFFVWKLSFNFIQKLFVVKTQNLRVSANNHQLLRFLVQYSVKKCKCISENFFKNSENIVNQSKIDGICLFIFLWMEEDILQQLLNIFAEVHNMIIWSAHSCV